MVAHFFGFLFRPSRPSRVPHCLRRSAPLVFELRSKRWDSMNRPVHTLTSSTLGLPTQVSKSPPINPAQPFGMAVHCSPTHVRLVHRYPTLPPSEKTKRSLRRKSEPPSIFLRDRTVTESLGRPPVTVVSVKNEGVVGEQRYRHPSSAGWHICV